MAKLNWAEPIMAKLSQAIFMVKLNQIIFIMTKINYAKLN